MVQRVWRWLCGIRETPDAMLEHLQRDLTRGLGHFTGQHETLRMRVRRWCGRKPHRVVRVRPYVVNGQLLHTRGQVSAYEAYNRLRAQRAA